MDFEHDNKRMNVQVDRLGSLPDELIHKILSFIDITDAIETSTLSSRWRRIWTSMPYLRFSTEYFNSLPMFSRYVTHVLLSRNNEIHVTSVDLTFRGKASQVFVKKILNYVCSHNVQELTVTCLFNKKDIEFPISLLNSQSLKRLTLNGSPTCYFITLTSTWTLPALTTLYLSCITLYDDHADLFSNCPNLKNLSLYWCRAGMNGFIIRHSQLSNLTLKSIYCKMTVDAPQLKNFRYGHKYHLPSLQFSADSIRSLENVNLICCPYEKNAHKVAGLLQQMHNVKFLTLSLELVEILSSNVELISHQPSPFANLKSLKIYPVDLRDERTKEKVINPIEVKKYFLDGCPSATLTIVSHEEINAIKNTTSAHKLMTELEVLLEQEKAKTETMLKQQNRQPVSKMQQQIGLSMERISGCLEYLSTQITRLKENASHIICKVHSIEGVFTKLPSSNRTVIQPRFTSLCAETDIVMNKITDCMMSRCKENQSRLRAYFHEIATALQPPT